MRWPAVMRAGAPAWRGRDPGACLARSAAADAGGLDAIEVCGRADADPAAVGGSGLVRVLRFRLCGSGGCCCSSSGGDGDAEGLQGLDVGADLLVPVGAAGVPVRAAAVAGGGVGQAR